MVYLVRMFQGFLFSGQLLRALEKRTFRHNKASNIANDI